MDEPSGGMGDDEHLPRDPWTGSDGHRGRQRHPLPERNRRPQPQMVPRLQQRLGGKRERAERELADIPEHRSQVEFHRIPQRHVCLPVAARHERLGQHHDQARGSRRGPLRRGQHGPHRRGCRDHHHRGPGGRDDVHASEQENSEGTSATAVNLSDIAAAGARPLGFVAALSMPASTDVEFLRGLAQGMEECVREFGIAVLGGDTKEADVLSIAGTAFGRVRKDRILLRSGARPGDVIVVTGDLGRAGHAARTLEQPAALRTAALDQLLRPYPRIADGTFFSESGAVTSCMDLSDGLGASLAQMAAMTKLSYQIEEAALPRYAGLASFPPQVAKELALYYGGDYELLATVRPDSIQPPLTRYSTAAHRERHRLTGIGKVAAAGGNVLLTKTGHEPLLAKGWEHFRSPGIR